MLHLTFRIDIVGKNSRSAYVGDADDVGEKLRGGHFGSTPYPYTTIGYSLYRSVVSRITLLLPPGWVEGGGRVDSAQTYGLLCLKWSSTAANRKCSPSFSAWAAHFLKHAVELLTLGRSHQLSLRNTIPAETDDTRHHPAKSDNRPHAQVSRVFHYIASAQVDAGQALHSLPHMPFYRAAHGYFRTEHIEYIVQSAAEHRLYARIPIARVDELLMVLIIGSPAPTLVSNRNFTSFFGPRASRAPVALVIADA